MRRFTAEEDQFLRDNYLTMPAKKMAKALGRKDCTARQRLQLLGLTVPPDIVEIFRQQSYIKKGAIPHNRDRKQTEYMSAEAIAKTKATQFKKGNLPPNTKNDQDISIRPDRRGVNYKFIRVGLAKWIPLQRYVWEEAHGPIPPRMKVIFKDGNPMNCDLDNLEMLSCADLMKKNSVHNYPQPIAQAIQLRGALNRQINKHLKHINSEK